MKSFWSGLEIIQVNKIWVRKKSAPIFFSSIFSCGGWNFHLIDAFVFFKMLDHNTGELRAMFKVSHSEKLQIVAKIRSKRGYDVDMLGAMGYNITTRKCNFLRFSVVR